jgi:hypothetical protein
VGSKRDLSSNGIAIEQIYLAEETSKNLTSKAKVLVTTE